MTSETALAIVKGDVKVQPTGRGAYGCWYNATGNLEYRPLPARHYEYALESWPGHRVYVHRLASTDEWTVTEPWTGAAIGRGATRQHALANANERIATWGLTTLHKAMADAIRMNGLSPAFEVV